MELQKAIEILEYYQDWRLGKKEDMIYEPKELTEALDIVVSEVRTNRLGADSSPSFDEWLDKYFKTPKMKMMYMRKDGKGEFDREALLKRYKRAYNP
jgi:hypothetical protein